MAENELSNPMRNNGSQSEPVSDGTGKSESALREEAVLKFWKENNVFQKSLEKKSPRGEFIFYEGPPTANGKPGIHHLEARAFKDAIPRYKTMRGFHVRRKGGWDTHGLPVELQVEKKLNLDSKIAIEKYGIAKFNQQCKESVWEYVDLWGKFTERIGYWVDQENPYVTYHNNYIESVWNILKKVSAQNLLYKDYKVVPWCPRCGTVLSSHELAQGYETIKDLSVYVKFKIKEQENIFILAWTTTPWTLPGNVALAVGKNIDYVKIKKENEFLILAEERLSVIDGEYEVIEELKGKDLIGLEYEPLYPFLQNTISGKEKDKMNKAYKIYSANFVTTEDGTGIVHTAVMYGQDDFVLGNKVGLPKHHLVGLDGKFLAGTGFLEGRFVRDEDVAVDIIKDLAQKGLLLKKEKYEHSYPHCWRCHTALIYYARDSWYIKMSDSKIKQKMIEENKDINWEPAHIRDGRFGEWLKDIKDWAISRERYWGSPLPVWICETCKKIEVVGSSEELKEKAKKSGNKYFIMRHGEAENNLESDTDYKNLNLNAKLTERGIEEILTSCKNFKEKIDIIISSPLERAKETTKIVCGQVGFPFEKIIYNQKIQEWEVSSIFKGKEKAIFKKYYDEDYLDKPDEALPDGESFAEVIKRVGQFIYELEVQYSNKNILIVGHEGVTNALTFVIKGLSLDSLSKLNNPFTPIKNAEIREFDFIPLPHNENYELDLHRPYIDEIPLVCECGGKMTRTKEVMDVWLDSGAMPFAQDHYPFDFARGKPFENKKLSYPADFICEAIDQTRGWFYTLHAVGILMGKGKAYKNVICLGHLLDAKGKKMSKSLGNIVDPWEMVEKYGADTLRLWMYSINQPGESKNFDEKTVLELHRQVFGLLYNVLAFYELYRNKNLENNNRPKSDNILDIWILAKLDELIELITKSLDKYKLLEPTRAIRDFIGDLSTWYLRRSRDRIKEGNIEAKQTLYFVLKNLAKLMAPFAPLAAEDIWLKLKNKDDAESVHLTSWPVKKFKIFSFSKTRVLESMETVRKIVTLGLEARQKAGIKVRQPLNRLEIVAGRLLNDYLEIIKDELNVKNVDYLLKIKIGLYKVTLDTKITPELKREGNYRELARAIQDMRKKMGLTPSDIVSLVVETDEEGKKLIQKFEVEIKKTILVSKIEFKQNNGEEIKIDELVFKIFIQK
ncbi:MAG: class I tRNA ligase family protein [Candidatus Paceibacterota bacterium]